MSETPGWSSPDPGQPAPSMPPTQQYDGPPPGQQFGAMPPPMPMAPKPGVIPLRPLNLGEILDGAISTMRAHPLAMLGAAAVVAVLTQLIEVPVTLWMFDDLVVITNIDPGTPAEDLITPLADLAGGLSAILLITLLARAFLAGVVSSVVGKAVLGQPVAVKGVWQDLKPRLLRLFGLALVIPLALLLATAAIVLIGLVAPPLAILLGLVAVLVAFWLAVLFSLATPALVLERGTVFRSLGRSRDLVRGSWWRVFGISLLATLIVSIIAAIIALPFEFIGGGGSITEIKGSLVMYAIVSGIGTTIAVTITEPFAAGVTSLLYIDQRTRREGLDIELTRQAAER